MRRLRGFRPSPAIVIAVLALVAAVAGTAVAGGPGATTSVSKKKTKQIAKKQVNKLAPGIANQEITERAPGLSVAHADIADTAQTAGFARVATDGSFGSSKGVAGVSHPFNGVYCFDLTFTPEAVVASGAFPDVRVPLTSAPAQASCPAGFQDASVALADTNSAPQNGPFYVVFE
jgi:hypothetical protein